MKTKQQLDPIKINKDEVLILKLEVLIHPKEIEKIRNDIIRQIEGGVVMIPNGLQYEICKREELERKAELQEQEGEG